MPHLTLLGDSIIDNAAYTQGQPAVVDQVSQLLPEGWRVTLGAVDGSTTDEVPAQLAALAPGTTHLLLSIGGNNAILRADLLDMPGASTAQALRLLSDMAHDFEAQYRQTI